MARQPADRRPTQRAAQTGASQRAAQTGASQRAPQSASRRPTQRAVALPEESAPEHWLRNIRFSGFSVLMLGLLVLAVIVLAPNLRILIEQRQQIAQLQ